MTLDRGFWKGLAGRAGAWLGAFAIGLLAVALAAHAVRTAREASEMEVRSALLAREVEQVRRESQSLRDEMRALESDPIYVESLLRRWKMAGRGERVIE
jgi:cell division protein FtsB